MAINTCAISGNLTRKPELRFTKSGLAVLPLRLAVNEYSRNAPDNKRTGYFDATVFGPQASGLATFLDKGMKVAVQGSLRYESWEENGSHRSRVVINADEVDVMSMGGRSEPSVGELQGEQAAAYYVDDLPF